MTKYYNVNEGEWIQPLSRKGHRMSCCDCGLVHIINFRIKKGKIQFQSFRNNRATAAMRRNKNLEMISKDKKS